MTRKNKNSSPLPSFATIMAVCAAKMTAHWPSCEKTNRQLKIHLARSTPFYGPLLGGSVEG